MATQTRPRASLADRAMLVNLKISRWQGRKKDATLTEELAQAKGSDVKWGSVTKKLVAGEALAELVTLEGAARAEHRRRTLAWSDDTDERILLHDGYFDYTEAMRAFEDRWAPAVAEFNRGYPMYRNQAKVLSPRYRDEDYPEPEEMLARFDFKVRVRPAPDADDFRVSLGDAEVARIQRSIEEEVEAVYVSATREIAGRVETVVGHMRDQLRIFGTPVEGSDKTHFFTDTLTENVWELVQILRTLNITGGTAIPDLADDICADLLPHSAMELRMDPERRNETVDAAEAILARMADFVA